MGTSRLPIFQERFKALRGEMTQGQFAEKLGISRPTVGLYESGARIPDAEVLRDIAEKCEVSADYLIGLSDVKSADPDVRMICGTTGLSEHAILTLQSEWHAPGGRKCIQVPDVMDYLLTDYSFNDEIMSPIQDAFQALRPVSESEDVKEALKKAEDNGFLLMQPFEAKDFFLHQAAGAFETLIRSMIDFFLEAEDGEHQED